MTRGVLFLEPDAHGVARVIRVEARIALACCEHCGSRPRVLPCDVLPRKHYGLAVIEHHLSALAKGDQSLRGVAWALLGERTPAHTTLHAWSEGLGAHALGREVGDVPGSVPHSALVQETEARIPEARDVEAPVVDERRYRSESRRERLAAVVRLLLVAVRATSTSPPRAVASWCALGLTWGLMFPLLFRTGLSSTRIEHPKVPNRARSPPR